MHGFIPLSGLVFIIVISTADSTILSRSGGGSYYIGAVVVFDVADSRTGQIERVGSEGPEDEIGRYGSSSPSENITGMVVHARDEDQSDHGCKKPYTNMPENVQHPWIALVRRGDCLFADKIHEASKANASAIIVYDRTNDVVTMSHPGADDIVSVIIPLTVGTKIVERLDAGYYVTVSIAQGQQYWSSIKDKTSIIFVSLSFLILMVISLTWLIVYYVQRFRLVQMPDVIKQRREQARKLVSTLPKKLLKENDKEITNEEICPICIENYKIDELLRILPCKHIYHRKCVDPWLRSRETCPMCKFDVLKSLGLLQENRQEMPDEMSTSTDVLVVSLVEEPTPAIVGEVGTSRDSAEDENLSPILENESTDNNLDISDRSPIGTSCSTTT